jgi:hypothetical protein
MNTIVVRFSRLSNLFSLGEPTAHGPDCFVILLTLKGVPCGSICLSASVEATFARAG